MCMSNNNREPVEWIEIDLDYCNLTFGSSPCTAALSSNVDRKCFNTFHTCKDQANFDKGTITYKLVQARSNYPKGETTFPCLTSVSLKSATANIAGADDEMYSLGKRGTVEASFVDFPYHDRFCDKYQSERVSGAAQFSGAGYDPKAYGTFWSRLRARNPNYSGRPMRHCTGFIENGILLTDTVRHFIMTELTRDISGGTATIKGKDILKLADDDRAVAPHRSRGKLTIDIDEEFTGSFDLNPATVGDEYSQSGFAAIGSEIVSFTRSGDTITIVNRGVSGTEAGSHSIDDAFQETFSPRLQRVDSVIYDLLILAGVDPAFIPYSDWQSECGRWASSITLTADIMKPTGVAKLIGELAILGVTIWWDDVDQEIKLKVNRPVDTDVVKDITDTSNIISSNVEDRDKDRITQVIFNYVQIDPSAGTDDSNFARGELIIAAAESSDLSFGDTKIKEINCRWFNHGYTPSARIASKRILNRFKVQPERYYIELDYRDDLAIAEVVQLTDDNITSDTGIPEPQLMQVIKREDLQSGHKVAATLQKFQFNERYAFFTENTRPVYTSSSDAQKARGAYWVGASEIFSDGTTAYKFA